jgi:AraC-like DNA-binding protein
MDAIGKIDPRIRNTIRIPDECDERYLPRVGPCTDGLASSDVLHGGVSRLVYGYELGRRAPRRHMLIVTDGGEGVLIVPGGELRMTPGTAAFSPAGTPHLFSAVREPWRIAWLYLADSSLWRRVAGRRPGIRAAPDSSSFLAACEGYMLEHHRLEHERNDSGGGAHAAGASRAADARGAGTGDWSRSRRTADDTLRDRSLSVCALWEELVLAYLDRYIDLVCSDGGGRDARIRALLSRVRRQPGDRWDVDAMARSLDMSQAQLTRDVKALTGRTPWQEVIRIRMELAADLLVSTDYPLKLIASRAGYSDAFVFSSAFKRHHGVSPDAYRRRVEGNSNPPERF